MDRRRRALIALLVLGCHAPIPASVTVEAAEPGDARWYGGARPSASGLREGDTTCGLALAVVYGDCRGWIGFASDGAVYEGNPAQAQLAPPVGAVSTLVARGDQVIVGGATGVARRVWVAGRADADAWAPVPKPDDLGVVTVVDALATAVRADLWYADADTLCHSDGGPPACTALAVRAIAAIPQGAWALDAAGDLWLVSAIGAPVSLSSHEASATSGGTLQAEKRPLSITASALAYDAGRGVLWVAATGTLAAVDPASGAERGRWTWNVVTPEALAIEAGGLRVFGAAASQRVVFGF